MIVNYMHIYVVTTYPGHAFVRQVWQLRLPFEIAKGAADDPPPVEELHRMERKQLRARVDA